MTDETTTTPDAETATIAVEVSTPVETAPKPAPLTLGAKEYAWGTGRRKTSVARVRLRPGSGVLMVNGKTFEEYFPVLQHRVVASGPLKDTGAENRYDIFCNVKGGGPTGQAGAVRLGIARSLVKVEPELDDLLREHGHLTRDGRMVERKKYGQRKARRAFQFSKR